MMPLTTARVAASPTAVALRLNAMTGWIMWALTSFFRELGVVAEGMETIAQPLTLVDAPGAIRVLETSQAPAYYVAAEHVATERLERTARRSMCEWKGQARYWALADEPGQVIAWDYPNPFPEFERLAGYLSFYPGRIECRVDGVRVQAQDGGFYGGWITPEIVGPFKGEPGTAGW